jgi:hypothetical protein
MASVRPPPAVGPSFGEGAPSGQPKNEGMNMSDTTKHEYLFDAKLFTSLRITAPSERRPPHAC